MDFGALIGLIFAYAIVIWGMFTTTALTFYMDFSSFLIVVMGTLGVVVTAYPLPNILQAVRAFFKVFTYSSQSQAALIAQLVSFAVRARRDGILTLESAEDEMQDAFLIKGIRLAVDGTDPDVINTILESDLEYTDQRHTSNIYLFDTISTIAPALGMIGTLIGLIAMLQSMGDPNSIGPAMAVALITTLYGAMIANMFSIPIATRLRVLSMEEQTSRLIMVAGIMSIQAGDNPRIVEQKLNAFVAPKRRKSIFDRK